MKPLILGLDCGGTKTAAALAHAMAPSSERVAFQTLGLGYSGPSNPYSLGYDQTFANILEAIRNAFLQSQLPQQTVASIAICMAGAGRDEEAKRIRTWALSQGLADHVHVGDDIALVRWAALWEMATTQTWDSIVTLIAGTGSIACCTDRNGNTERVGGWGYLLGDEGSGFWIGLQSLKSLFAAHDQKRPLSRMQQELLEAMRCHSITELIPAVYRNPLPRSEIAALSPILMRHAASDSLAHEILERAMESLSQLVDLVLKRSELHHRPYLLAVSGGLFESTSPMLQGLQGYLAKQQCAPSRVHVVQHPVYGALTLAAMQCNHAKQ